MNGKIANYTIKPAREHDFEVGYGMNHEWFSYGVPKIIDDKGYYAQDGYITPPKTNEKTLISAGKTNFIS